MSVIARQSVKYSIVGYLGSLIGILSTAFLFTHNFAFFGKIRYVLSTAELLAPLVILGISYSNVKFFYQTQLDGKNQNMLSLSLASMFITFFIFILGISIASYLFPSIKNLLFWEYKWAIIPLVLILSLSQIFNKYISNYKRIVITNVFENLMPKLANIIAFVLYVYLYSTEVISLGVFIGLFAMSLLGYYWYANRLEPITFDFTTQYFKQNKLWKHFFNYSFYGFLGTFGSYVLINNTMIGEFLGEKELGIYSTLFAMISVVSIPQMGIFNISAPIINKSIAENNLEELDELHKKTSLTLFFLGAVIFSCIITGFPYLTTYIKNGELLREYEPVVWIWGSAVLLDLATGFNGNIISMSKYYKFNIYMMLVLSASIIGLNYYFINNTDLKLVGIAISTAVSLSIFNLIKITFNYFKFKVFPFTIEMMFVSIISTLAVTVAIIMPNFTQDYINLFYKPAVVLLLIFIGNYFTKIFPLEKYINFNFLKSLIKFK